MAAIGVLFGLARVSRFPRARSYPPQGSSALVWAGGLLYPAGGMLARCVKVLFELWVVSAGMVGVARHHDCDGDG